MMQTQTKKLTPPRVVLGLIFMSQKTNKDGSSQRMNRSELYKSVAGESVYCPECLK